jgi:hypothetical protein
VITQQSIDLAIKSATAFLPHLPDHRRAPDATKRYASMIVNLLSSEPSHASAQQAAALALTMLSCFVIDFNSRSTRGLPWGASRNAYFGLAPLTSCERERSRRERRKALMALPDDDGDQAEAEAATDAR